jgi:hypothetical protein
METPLELGPSGRSRPRYRPAWRAEPSCWLAGPCPIKLLPPLDHSCHLGPRPGRLRRRAVPVVAALRRPHERFAACMDALPGHLLFQALHCNLPRAPRAQQETLLQSWPAAATSRAGPGACARLTRVTQAQANSLKSGKGAEREVKKVVYVQTKCNGPRRAGGRPAPAVPPETRNEAVWSSVLLAVNSGGRGTRRRRLTAQPCAGRHSSACCGL